MPRPILTLTTDFGLSDHFVGVMKGVILGICPQAHIVDITHDVAPFMVSEGAFRIAQAYPYFPKKTVHVVVIDPGVGSERRPILAEARGQYFVAPDNGVLSMVYAREKHAVRAIANSRYFLKAVSQTFHGRDVFAPTAAHLAAGTGPGKLGKPIDDYIRLDFAKPKRTGTGWAGNLLAIDRFGNLITNLQVKKFPDLANSEFSLRLAGRRIRALARTYAERAPSELFLIAGSSGYWEVSVNQGSAARLVGCQAGDAIELKLGDRMPRGYGGVHRD